MTTLDTSLATLRSAAGLVSSSYDWFTRWLKSMMPTGLYGRALLIIITPMVVLQSVVAFVFMERHWNTVTYRRSAAVTQDIAALIDFYRASADLYRNPDPDLPPAESNEARIQRIASSTSPPVCSSR